MLVLTPEERQEPDRLLQRLKQSPWQLLFDTSAFSKSNVRQVMVRVHADAENTPYNSPALLRELLVPATFGRLRRSGVLARKEWQSERARAAAATLQVEESGGHCGDEADTGGDVDSRSASDGGGRVGGCDGGTEAVGGDAMSSSDGVEEEDDDMSYMAGVEVDMVEVDVDVDVDVEVEVEVEAEVDAEV